MTGTFGPTKNWVNAETITEAGLDATAQAPFDSLNSLLDSSNKVADGDLASPNNSTYKTLLTTSDMMGFGDGAATYVLGTGGTDGTNITVPIVSGATWFVVSQVRRPPPSRYFDDADFTVGSLTQKLRLRAQLLCNNVSQGTVTFTFGLYPLTVAGSSSAITLTLGTVVSGSTVAIVNPTNANNGTTNQGNSGDFTIPADGHYALGVAITGTSAASSVQLVQAQLQTRNV